MEAAATHLCPKDKSIPDTVGLRLYSPPLACFFSKEHCGPHWTRQAGPFPSGSLHYWVGNEAHSSL